jgi:hypothetical protein
MWLHSYDSLRLSGSQALGDSGTAPFLAGPDLRCSQTCPNNFPAQVCNVWSIATTMSMLERWGWSRRSGKSRERLSGGPVSSCRPRFSTNSFIVSFGGKRPVKGNEEDRSWHSKIDAKSVPQVLKCLRDNYPANSEMSHWRFGTANPGPCPG